MSMSAVVLPRHSPEKSSTMSPSPPSTESRSRFALPSPSARSAAAPTSISSADSRSGFGCEKRSVVSLAPVEFSARRTRSPPSSMSAWAAPNSRSIESGASGPRATSSRPARWRPRTLNPRFDCRPSRSRSSPYSVTGRNASAS